MSCMNTKRRAGRPTGSTGCKNITAALRIDARLLNILRAVTDRSLRPDGHSREKYVDVINRVVAAGLLREYPHTSDEIREINFR